MHSIQLQLSLSRRHDSSSGRPTQVFVRCCPRSGPHRSSGERADCQLFPRPFVPCSFSGDRAGRCCQFLNPSRSTPEAATARRRVCLRQQDAEVCHPRMRRRCCRIFLTQLLSGPFSPTKAHVRRLGRWPGRQMPSSPSHLRTMRRHGSTDRLYPTAVGSWL